MIDDVYENQLFVKKNEMIIYKKFEIIVKAAYVNNSYIVGKIYTCLTVSI
jgi:hypothetical protein